MEKVLLKKDEMWVKARGRIDKRRWEDFVESSSQSSVFQTVEFASVMGAMSRMTPVFLTVEDVCGEIQAGVLIFVNMSKNIFLKRFPYRIYVYEIPMFLDTSKGIAALDHLLEGLDKFAGQMGVPKIEVVPRYHGFDSSNSEKVVRKLFAKHGYEYETICTIMIDLSKSIDELWKSLKKKKRYNIRAAKRKGLETKAEDIMETKEYYKLHCLTYYRLGLQPEPYSFFESVWKHFVSAGLAKVIFVDYKHRPIAAQIVLIDSNSRELYAWSTGSDSRVWRLRPNDLLYWATVECGKQFGYKTLDLVHYYPDTPGSEFYSLYCFKRDFGSTAYLDAYSKVCSRARLSAWNLLHPVYKFMTQIAAEKQKNLIR